MNAQSPGLFSTDMSDKKEIDLFWHISRSLASKRYLAEVLQLIVTMTAEVMGSKICSLMLLDADDRTLRIAASQSLSETYLNKGSVQVGESVSGRAVLEARPIAVLNVLDEKDYRFPDIARQEGIVSLLSVPMMLEERCVGVINCYRTREHRWTDAEIKILQAVANHAAVAIESAKLRQENSEAKEALERERSVERAKGLLMEREGLKAGDAYDLMMKISDDQGMPLVEVANAVILVDELRRKKPGPPPA